ncbi:MAG: succinylglutamate desuccinylase [Solimicrobium sp.]|jgi:succinylglutamate desuccinylase|nr:succinylglutamate desuccinylase [Solimicrobium sp.]
MDRTLTPLAKGDFSSLANSFMQAGFVVRQPYAGILQINTAQLNTERMRLLISVGVHGNETTPIEMMALLLEELTNAPHLLGVDLMIVVGNLPAIAEKKRFIDADLNRKFSLHRASPDNTIEAQRADQLMEVTEQFFAGYKNNVHLDLHTAIRASAYTTFAIVPGKTNFAFLSWLGSAGIQAVILSPQPSVTFSSFTCEHLGAISCTAELGRIGDLGKNDLSQFLSTQSAIGSLLRSGLMRQENQLNPTFFRVAQELIKRSDAFQFIFDRNTPNFTEFSPGSTLAFDNDITYSVGEIPEYVLFPNSDVDVGLRAGLMLVRV